MGLDIAIIGSGIGGPAAAIGLARNGHIVTLYERSANIVGSVGYAFRITPNADRCLKWLGIDTVAAGAVAANTGRIMAFNGKVIADFQENVDPEKAKNATSVFAYRPALQQQLLDATEASGAKIKTGMRVASVDVEKTSITFEDGGSITADLIVAADGVHSSVRKYIVDPSVYYPKVSAGQSCLRFTIPKQTILDDPVAAPIINDNFRMFLWSGANKRVVVYPVDFDREYNFSCTHPEELSSQETTGDKQGSADAIAYNQKISLNTVKSIYSEFDPVAIRLFELADPNGFRVWKLMDLDELPQWSANRTVLLGDSGHSVLPFGYAGAGMAIEDAVTLAQLLPSDIKKDDIQDRLALFERIRKPRVAEVREKSRFFGKGDDSDPKAIQAYREFLGSHDAIEYAKDQLAAHLKGQ